ncbi:hypothetical protein C7M84_014391 [Penaeus vannamei]|uniref:Uncharacterized protein n=1 Tax=Penaeus vannamei TaxID=6689 RepID=A0A423STL7_PENVA|nr:hypothetical protein C7M84_014391 [Penaeus vannamei]
MTSKAERVSRVHDPVRLLAILLTCLLLSPTPSRATYPGTPSLLSYSLSKSPVRLSYSSDSLSHLNCPLRIHTLHHSHPCLLPSSPIPSPFTPLSLVHPQPSFSLFRLLFSIDPHFFHAFFYFLSFHTSPLCRLPHATSPTFYPSTRPSPTLYPSLPLSCPNRHPFPIPPSIHPYLPSPPCLSPISYLPSIYSFPSSTPWSSSFLSPSTPWSSSFLSPSIPANPLPFPPSIHLHPPAIHHPYLPVSYPLVLPFPPPILSPFPSPLVPPVNPPSPTPFHFSPLPLPSPTPWSSPFPHPLPILSPFPSPLLPPAISLPHPLAILSPPPSRTTGHPLLLPLPILSPFPSPSPTPWSFPFSSPLPYPPAHPPLPPPLQRGPELLAQSPTCEVAPDPSGGVGSKPNRMRSSSRNSVKRIRRDLSVLTIAGDGGAGGGDLIRELCLEYTASRRDSIEETPLNRFP